MLAQLSEHFREPVMPISRYCQGLRTWQSALHERAHRIREELFPGLDGPAGDPVAEKAFEAYSKAKAFERSPEKKARDLSRDYEPTDRDDRLDDLWRALNASEKVDTVFCNISKSNLLARLLYVGEKLRQRICPMHKGTWSGIEFGDNVCPHGCQLTGWIQEDEDKGTPLPGVQVVELVGAETVIINDVDGTELGKAKV